MTEDIERYDYIMKKKAIPVLVALLLIVVIGGVSLGKLYFDKYSYSKEMADLDAYFGVSGDESAIVLQDELVDEKAILRDGSYYLDLDTVHKYLNEAFYADRGEKLLLYATPTDVIRVNFGENSYTAAAGVETTDYIVAFEEGDEVYIAMDYVKLFTNYSYESFERHLQVYTQWGSRETAETTKVTLVRERGGVKSAILREVAQGETVEILERMENWSRVKTSDSLIGYIENKRLTAATQWEETPVTEYEEPEYTDRLLEGKVSLGFHAIGGMGGNDTLESMVSGTKGMKVIAPTWFSLNDADGNFRSFGSGDYVNRAHNLGLQVWGVLDDFNYKLESGATFDDYTILSSTAKRQHLVAGIIDTAVSLGMDGINIDFEKVNSETGEHFVQFLRELSVGCRNSGLVLSVDNYVPFQFNDYYRLDVQGQILDYVIIMGYDEHWHGSKEPGSVASINYVSNGLERTVQEVPANKVINAVPFYTIVWRTENEDVTDEYLTMNKTESYLGGVDATIQWDEETGQNYAEWTSGSAFYQIWLEDEASIGEKLNAMNAHQVGGVAVWRLGYGTPGVWDMLNNYVNVP